MTWPTQSRHGILFCTARPTEGLTSNREKSVQYSWLAYWATVLFGVLWVCLGSYDLTQAAQSKAVQRYEAVKSDMETLRKDERRSQWREPWEQLASRFLKIYQTEKEWVNRPAALFRSAVALDELASRSYVKKDMHTAIERYQDVVDAHRSNPLADDALYDAARLAWHFKDSATALKLLDQLVRNVPKGDMFSDAKLLAEAIKKQQGSNKTSNKTTSSSKNTQKTAPKPAPKPSAAPLPEITGELTDVRWSTRKAIATVTLQCDTESDYVVRSYSADSNIGRPPRLVVELHNVTVNRQVKPGDTIKNSLLSRVRVDTTSPEGTRIYLDFSKLQRFSVKVEKSPFRLVITAAGTDSALPKGNKVGQTVHKITAPKSEIRVPTDITRQLGLSVRKVIIDPGHGGNDPGTAHNGLVERTLMLDMAKRVGKLLQKHKIKVEYTRTKDVRVSLEDRSRMANEAKGDLFLSLHLNANTDPSVDGFETYFLDFASSSTAARLAGVENELSERSLGELEGLLADLMLSARTQESRRVAEFIQKKTLENMRKRKYTPLDGGVRSAPFHVLLGANMPGVLVEVGYCTNKAEAKKLKQSAYLNTLAEGIVNGVLGYAQYLERAGVR